jgi:hypothetical protein
MDSVFGGAFMGTWAVLGITLCAIIVTVPCMKVFRRKKRQPAVTAQLTIAPIQQQQDPKPKNKKVPARKKSNNSNNNNAVKRTHVDNMMQICRLFHCPVSTEEKCKLGDRCLFYHTGDCQKFIRNGECVGKCNMTHNTKKRDYHLVLEDTLGSLISKERSDDNNESGCNDKQDIGSGDTLYLMQLHQSAFYSDIIEKLQNEKILYKSKLLLIKQLVMTLDCQSDDENEDENYTQ